MGKTQQQKVQYPFMVAEAVALRPVASIRMAQQFYLAGRER